MKGLGKLTQWYDLKVLKQSALWVAIASLGTTLLTAGLGGRWSSAGVVLLAVGAAGVVACLVFDWRRKERADVVFEPRNVDVEVVHFDATRPKQPATIAEFQAIGALLNRGNVREAITEIQGRVEERGPLWRWRTVNVFHMRLWSPELGVVDPYRHNIHVEGSSRALTAAKVQGSMHIPEGITGDSRRPYRLRLDVGVAAMPNAGRTYAELDLPGAIRRSKPVHARMRRALGKFPIGETQGIDR